MKYKYQSKSLLILMLVALCSSNLFGQLTVDLNMTPQQMAQNLVGTGVQISNVVVTACDSSYGYYNSVGTEMGTNQGLLLTTGKAQYAIGPNNKIGTCSSSGAPGFINCDYFDNGCPGSTLLNQVHDRTTRDATMFEFDIVPQGDSLKFSYSFASEEYNEWVGSPFNDVFGFFISGPNVGTDVNLAVIPNTNQLVAINTVNASNNTQYWYNNSSPFGQGVQYDAFTVNLIAAIGNLIPCETYHLKLVIADGTDYVYDSGVFINAIESNPVVVLTATSNGLDYMVEGCNPGTITFSREFASSTPLDVTYWVGGTATNGVDYTPQLGSGIPNDPIVITIPSGEQTVTIDLNANDDGIDEGTEYIAIYLANPSCQGSEILDSVLFYIHDELDVSISPDDATVCAGQCVELVGSSSLGDLADFEWSAGVSDPNSLTVEVCPLANTTYSLTAIVGECSAMDEVEVVVTNLTLELDGTDIFCEGGATGFITSTVLGGTEPYTYAWTGPNGFTSADANPTELVEGEYCLTVSDVNNCSAEACVTLVETNELNAVGDLSSYVCFPISCFGACDGAIDLTVTGGVEPFNYVWTGPSGYTSIQQNIEGLCAGTYDVEITDAAGCVFTNTFTLAQPEQLEITVTGTVDLLCTGVETGQANVASTGGCAPYTYAWSHDAGVTGPNAINLASGTYDVSVTDQNGCANDGTVTIVINDPINPVTATLDQVSLYPGGFGVSCPGAEDGFINITVSGGSEPYSVEWMDVATNTLFSSQEDLADAPCGEYQLVVTDANECTYSQNFIISCVPAITVDFITVPNPCGTPLGGLGEIALDVSGGHGGTYTFSWTGPDGFTSSDEDLVALNSGDYVVTVTDSEGCITQVTINVGQNDQFTVAGDVTNASCFGECDGAIAITVDPVGTYGFAWTGPNGFTNANANITGLCAGTYTLMVTTDDCEETYTFNVSQPLQLEITPTVVEPLCFGQNNGSIDIVVANGSGDYSYSWAANPSCIPPFAGASTQNIANLFACDYTVTVTDNVTNCTQTLTITLEAPQVMDLVPEVSNHAGGYNISCNGGSDGAINVFVTGGTPDCSGFSPECYFYDWVTPACATENPADYGNLPNGNSVNNLPAGTYGVLVTDANGCLATVCIPLTEPPAIESAAVIDHIDCGETTGSITPNIEGGSGNYASFEWTGNIGSNAPNATTLIGLGAGTYTLTVTDFNDCEETFEYIINQIPTPVVELIEQTDLNCSNECIGAFTIEVSDGLAPYTVTVNGDEFTVNNNGDQLILENLCADTYDVLVVDANDCEVSTSVTITEPLPLELSLAAIIQEDGQTFHLQCFGDENGAIASTITGGSGTYDYVWTDADLNVLSSNDTLFDLAAGTYCLEITDANGCTIQECFEITQPASVLESTSVLSLYNDIYNISCFGAEDGSIDITTTGGVGPYSYDWEGTGIVDGQEDQSGLAAGEYALVIVDANFCQLPFLFNLVQPEPIVIDAQVSLYDGGFNISCNGACNGTITLNLSGGSNPYTVAWTGPDGFNSDQLNLTELCPGTYEVTVTDVSGCEQIQSVVISEPAVLSVVIDNTYDCANAESQLCASANGGSGVYTYAWSTGATSSCIVVDESGEYCVTITDSNGCEEEVCFVANITLPLSATGVITNASCGLCNGAINTTITGSAGLTISWDNGAVTEDLTGLCAGTYVLTVTDVNNCSTVHTFTVVQNEDINALVNTTNVACNGETSGAATAVVTGATLPLTYEWQDVQLNTISNSENVDGLDADQYYFIWSDAAGCIDTLDVFITEPSILEVEIETSVFGDFNISTVGGSDGSIELEVTGGTPLYTYDWSHDSEVDGALENGLPAGDYTITITDANGCVLDTTVTLIQPEEVRLFKGISPNGDGFNDFYVIPGVLYCSQANLTIFNRWGNIVYEKANYKNEWYGQSTDGGTLSDGTYFVIFEGCDNKKLSTYVDLRRE